MGNNHSITNSRASAQKHAERQRYSATRGRGGDSLSRRGEAASNSVPHPSEPGYFHRITELHNLNRLWFRTKQSRSLRPRYVKFNLRRLHYLSIIQARLREGQFEFGPYQYFWVQEKSRRSIANAPLKDRVVQWMLYEHLIGHWSRRFIYDSFGNLPGKGTHAAVKRVAGWARKTSLPYALQIDVSKFFPSIQHHYLKQIVLRREGNHAIRELLISLIESFQTGNEFDHLFPVDHPYRKTVDKGLPSGNLSSPTLANIYLNEFDHWVKEVLRFKHYMRYVDDLIFFSDSKEELHKVKDLVLAELLRYGLSANPHKIAIRRVKDGIPYLGYVVWPNHISAGKYVRKKYGRLLRRSEGRDVTLSRASYQGIFKHTGPTR